MKKKLDLIEQEYELLCYLMNYINEYMVREKGALT